ncbi:MAG: hypothetical protein AAF985_18615 [Bacteroidota bacterium]
MRKMIVTCWMCCICVGLQAQSSPRNIVKLFFHNYEKDPEVAVDFLYSTNKWIDLESNVVKEIKSNLKANLPRMGAYLDRRLLGQSSLGRDLQVRIYLVRYERKPLRFTFHFYKSKDKWIIYRFNFDDFLFEDMEENMKFNYLNSLN